MNIEIITRNFQKVIYGFGGIALNKDYVATAFKLSGKMEVIKTKKIKNKGINVWVYETGDKVFAGVELENHIAGNNHELEEKKITLEKYDVGPYKLIKQTGQKIISELTSQGFKVILPYIEIYGHWTGDENKSETELLMCLK